MLLRAEKMILRRGGEKLRYCGGTPRPLLRRLAKRDAVVRRLAKRDAKPEAAHTRMARRPNGRKARTAAAVSEGRPTADRQQRADGGRQAAEGRDAQRAARPTDDCRQRRHGGRRATEGRHSLKAASGARRGRGYGRAGRRLKRAAVRRYRSARRARSSPTEERWRGGKKKAKGKAAEGRQLTKLDITVIVLRQGGGKAERLDFPLTYTIKTVMFN